MLRVNMVDILKIKNRGPGMLGIDRLVGVSYIFQGRMIWRIIWKEERYDNITNFLQKYLGSSIFLSEAENKLGSKTLKR